MAAFDLKHRRVQAGMSQLQLALRSGVGRWRLRLHEQGVLQLRKDEILRIRIALKFAKRETRNIATLQERVVAETLREFKKQTARSSEAAI